MEQGSEPREAFFPPIVLERRKTETARLYYAKEVGRHFGMRSQQLELYVERFVFQRAPRAVEVMVWLGAPPRVEGNAVLVTLHRGKKLGGAAKVVRYEEQLGEWSQRERVGTVYLPKPVFADCPSPPEVCWLTIRPFY